MTEPLKRVLITHAKDGFQSQNHLSRHWKSFGYSYQPDFQAACQESDAFIRLLEDAGVVVCLLGPEFCHGLDSLYVHDPIVTLPDGFGVCRMGKDLRSEEPSGIAKWLSKEGYSIKGHIEGQGSLEGGDVVWLTSNLVAIGIGYRTNQEGADQLRIMAGFSDEQLICAHLPHWNGPSDVLHLMSMISPIDDRTLLTYSRLLPVTFRNRLLSLGFELLEVPEDEYDSMGCNVLSLGKKRCVIEQKNTRTASLLRKNGFDVITYSGDHISRPGEGGPTCLTRPLLRG